MFLEKDHTDLNVLINNAGIQYNYNFTEKPQLLVKIEHESNVKFTAPLKLIALTLTLLQLNSNAVIVNVSCGLGLVLKMAAPVYCGTKAVFISSQKHFDINCIILNF